LSDYDKRQQETLKAAKAKVRQYIYLTNAWLSGEDEERPVFKHAISGANKIARDNAKTMAEVQLTGDGSSGTYKLVRSIRL
jgi:hypothetical protein